MTKTSTPLAGSSGASTNEHTLAERRAAARALLSTPFLSVAQHADELALVRRHKVALRQMFQTQLGYPVVIEPTFARLVKAVPPKDVPPRGAKKNSGAEFAPRTYTYLALVCAGLMSPGSGEQVLVGQLVEQLRADAATAGISINESIGERRALVAAIDQLINWGVLTETDGTVAAWGERREEALLTINRALLPHVIARPLAGMTGPEEMWTLDETVREQPRPALRRRLTEHPLARREDLTDAETDVLSRERRDLARILEDSFGLTLEVRLEGALAYDVENELTDFEFPGQGTIRQAALLLLDALVDLLRPAAGQTAFVNGVEVPGALAPWDLVAENIEDLVERNAKAWRADVAGDLGRLTEEIFDVLESVSLARRTSEGLVLHPACARYRPAPVRPPSRTRARANERAEHTDTTLFAEADLDDSMRNQELP